MREELVRIESLTKTFPGVLALSRARFELDAGTISYLARPVEIPGLINLDDFVPDPLVMMQPEPGETVKYGNIILRKGVIPAHRPGTSRPGKES